eukprot:scaffold77511_cov18-Phaeocystis_antarctica.AAC.1
MVEKAEWAADSTEEREEGHRAGLERCGARSGSRRDGENKKVGEGDAAEGGGKKDLSIGARANGRRGEGGGLNSKDAGEGGE